MKTILTLLIAALLLSPLTCHAAMDKATNDRWMAWTAIVIYIGAGRGAYEIFIGLPPQNGSARGRK